MKYSAAVLLFAAGALAQDVTSAVSSSAATPTGLSSAVQCALACEAGDVTCQAQCLGNARPNASQAIATNECAAKCDQGDGSPSATEAYSKCVDSCINSLFPSSQTAFQDGGAGAASPSSAAAAGSSAAGSAANSAQATATSGSASGTASGTAASSNSASGSTASPSSTDSAGAADKATVQYFGAGLAGLLAVFAL